MEAVRILLAAGFFGLAAVTFFFFTDASRFTGVSVTGAELAPSGDDFVLTLEIENTGDPDVLTGIGSEAAGRASLAGGAGPLAIPAGAVTRLSPDGVHGVLSDVMGGAGEGRVLPVTLWFERAGKVTIRARIL